jgi:hypothetical protein
MEKLPKDMVEKLMNDLMPRELINFCTANISSNNLNVKRVCNSNDLWIKRFNKDFAIMVPLINDLSTNAKRRYLEVFSKISKKAEQIINLILEAFEDFTMYLTERYKEDLYRHFYDLIYRGIGVLIANTNKGVVPAYYPGDIASGISHSLGSLKPPEFNSESYSNYFWSDLIDEANLHEFFESFIKYLNIAFVNLQPPFGLE